MKWALCVVLLLCVWTVAPHAEQTAVQMKPVWDQYQEKRPFSWYYPYEYEYYYPRRTPQKQVQCYWIYTNGAYFYVCS
jgi:hypothetical protein